MELASKIGSQLECTKLASKLGFEAHDLIKWRESKDSVEEIAMDILLKWSSRTCGTEKWSRLVLIKALKDISRSDLAEIFKWKCEEWTAKHAA